MPPSKEEAKAVRTRQELLDHIANKHPEGLAKYFDVVDSAALDKGSSEDAKWLMTMVAGGPKQTVIQEISIEKADQVIDIIGEFVPEEKREECLTRLQAVLNG